VRLLLAALLATSALGAADKAVVVELFTSEGCSSCPPADRLLEQLHRIQPIDGVEIIVLSEHVDYWNRLGWKDPFSDKAFSDRQQWYSMRWPTRVYTPQAVIDGLIERVGSEAKKIQKVILSAAQERKGKVGISVTEGQAVVTVSDLPRESPAEVRFAVVEDDLAVEVERGENKGRRLAHVGVVRSFQTVGEMGRKDGERSFEVPFELAPEWNEQNLRLVAFVQERRTRAIVAAATVPVSRSETSPTDRQSSE
jgi:hypothetical protein